MSTTTAKQLPQQMKAKVGPSVHWQCVINWRYNEKDREEKKFFHGADIPVEDHTTSQGIAKAKRLAERDARHAFFRKNKFYPPKGCYETHAGPIYTEEPFQLTLPLCVYSGSFISSPPRAPLQI